MSTAAARRRQCWSAAAALAARGSMTARQARLLRNLEGAALSWDDLMAAPEWIHWPAEKTARLVRFTGAAASRAWRGLNGESLRAAAAALGEPALDLLLRKPPVEPCEGAVDARAMDALGARLLLAQCAGRPGLVHWLASRLGAPATPHPDTRLAVQAAAIAMDVLQAVDGRP